MSGDKITNGKFVSLTYSIVDDNGNLVEHNDIPVSYIHGGEVELIGGMDKAIEGRQAGDSVQVRVPPEEGFGEHDPSLTFTDDLENVPPEFHQLGAEVPMHNDSGEVKTFHVTRIEDGRLTVDGNHPLAGKTLNVNVRIREVRDATKEDAMTLSSGPQSIH